MIQQSCSNQYRTVFAVTALLLVGIVIAPPVAAQNGASPAPVVHIRKRKRALPRLRPVRPIVPVPVPIPRAPRQRIVPVPLPVAPQQRVGVVQRPVYLRVGPSKLAAKIRQLSPGTVLTIVGMQDGFYQAVTTKGRAGYVAGDAVQLR